MKKVLVVYHYFAHYRLPVMKEMSCSEKIKYSFASGTDSEINIKKVDFMDSVESGVDIEWHRLKNIWFKGGPVLWQRGLLSLIMKGDWDAIVFLGSPYFLSTWLGALVSRAKGIKVLYWTHGAMRDGGMKDLFRARFFHLADHLLIYSRFGMENLAEKGFDKAGMTVINNSLDYDLHLNLRNTLSISDGDLVKNRFFKSPELPLLLFIGRLTPQKKLDWIIKAQSRLQNKGLKVNLLFVGSGEQESALKQSSVELALDGHVGFYGACHDDSVLAPIIAAADLCVSPGEVGLTAIHCLSFGTPVVTHDNSMRQMPEYESIVHGKTGMLYKYESLDSLVESIESWLESDRLRDDVRKNCYEIIDSLYTPTYQVEKIAEAVNGLVD
jgi:glycosyltransferase involved in cell wall biosynthesis